jgi:hypothetical protein
MSNSVSVWGRHACWILREIFRLSRRPWETSKEDKRLLKIIWKKYYDDKVITNHNDKEKTVRELVVELGDHKHEIPLLVIFANKLLKIARDLFEDIDENDQYHSLSNFFELFNNLAEAGPEIKRYMIMGKFLSWLLDILYDSKSVNKHYHRALSHLATYEINNPEMALVLKEDRDEDEEEVEVQVKKFSKSKRETEDKRYNYLYRTIWTLVWSWKFKLSGSNYIGADSLFWNSSNPIEMDDREITVIHEIANEEMINDFLIRANHGVSTAEAISNMYAHLCWENEEVSTQLMNMIWTILWSEEATFIDVIKYTPLIVNLAKINDSFSEMRMTTIIQNLFENAFVDNFKKYVKYSDSILNTIMLVIRRNADACRYMRSLDNPMKAIEKFYDKNPFPKAYSNSQVLFRSMEGEKVDRWFSDSDK